ncbi:hypothetical protein V7S43_013852 [Phytophthora oleae]|uniref:Uncharacterized protein n=1 Tax=Phytophthora oleae TaxID=2107226 RepID=A0ABD3F396_9STRA
MKRSGHTGRQLQQRVRTLMRTWGGDFTRFPPSVFAQLRRPRGRPPEVTRQLRTLAAFPTAIPSSSSPRMTMVKNAVTIPQLSCRRVAPAPALDSLGVSPLSRSPSSSRTSVPSSSSLWKLQNYRQGVKQYNQDDVVMRQRVKMMRY